MFKKTFLIFCLVMGIWIGAAIAFIQSEHFARQAKTLIARYGPKDLGILIEFDHLSIKLFPPGVTINHPKVTLSEKNVLGLPVGNELAAERVDLIFLPLQMLSGRVTVNDVRIYGGEANLDLSSTTSEKPLVTKTSRTWPTWKELSELPLDQIQMENLMIHLKVKRQGQKVVERLQWKSQFASLAKADWKGKPGFALYWDAREIQVDSPEWVTFLKKSGIQTTEQPEFLLRARVSADELAVEHLKLQWRDLIVRISGETAGDILPFLDEKAVLKKSLPSRLQIQLEGDLLQWPIARLLNFQNVEGQIKAEAELTGDLRNAPYRLRGQGSVNLLRPNLSVWGADELAAKWKWSGPIQEGGSSSLQVNEFKLRADGSTTNPVFKRGVAGKGIPRGWGGVITAAPFQLEWSGARFEDFEVGLNLQDAHLHWLASVGLKEIYPLDFRVGGQVKAEFQSSKGSSGWKLRSQLDLKIPHFDLNNQKLGVKKPYFSTVNAENLHLSGAVVVSPAGLTIESVQLSLPRSKFTAKGSVTGAQGYDIRAEGEVVLADVGSLAGNVIRGSGPLKTWIHGPSDRVMVDFEGDIKDAYYLKLHLGDFNGLVSLDETKGHLHFKNCRVTRGSTQYVANGLLNLFEPDSIKLNIQVPTGNLREFSGIFQELTEDLWWYPRTLQGPIVGEILVEGGLSLDELLVEGRLTGQDWEYLGEKFKLGRVTGGFDRGKYYIKMLDVVKKQGSFVGQISLDREKTLAWRLSTEGLQLDDFDHIATLDVPLRGNVKVVSEGSGPLDRLVSQTLMTIDRVNVRGNALPKSQLLLKSNGDEWLYRGTALGSQGALEGRVSRQPMGTSFIKADLRNLDFSPLVMLINPELMEDPELAGLLSGQLDLTYPAGKWQEASGQIHFERLLLQKTDQSYELVEQKRVEVKGGDFLIQSLGFGNAKRRMFLDAFSSKGILTGRILGQIDLEILEFLTSAIPNATGSVSVDMDLRGSLTQPEVRGTLTAGGPKDQPIVLGLQGIGNPIENVTGTVVWKQDLIQVPRLRGDLGGGSVLLTGGMELFLSKVPKLDFNVKVVDPKIKMYPFQSVEARGDLKITGESFPYLLSGEFDLRSGLIKEKFMSGNQNKALRAARYEPPPSTKTDSNFPKWKLDIRAKADNRILVQNDLFDLEVKADIQVINTLTVPRLLGRVDLVQGKLLFKDRAFQIDSALVEFDQPTVFNPKLNLTAHTEVGQNRIQVYSHGRMDQFKVEFSSVPAMPESEILSLLAIGFTSDEMSRLKQGDRRTVEQGEAASLVLHSTEFNKNLEEKTGFQVKIDEAVDQKTGSSVFRPKSEGEVSSGPKIVIRRQLGKKVDVSVGSTVGVGSSSQKEVNAEFKVTPNFSIMGVWDTTEGVDTQARDSYGVDFKLQKRFK